MNMTDEERQRVYRDALQWAKGDFDVVSLELAKMQDVVNALRRVIIGTSALLNEEVDDKYQYPALVKNSLEGAGRVMGRNRHIPPNRQLKQGEMPDAKR
jgi:hypothetical protein